MSAMRALLHSGWSPIHGDQNLGTVAHNLAHMMTPPDASAALRTEVSLASSVQEIMWSDVATEALEQVSCDEEIYEKHNQKGEGAKNSLVGLEAHRAASRAAISPAAPISTMDNTINGRNILDLPRSTMFAASIADPNCDNPDVERMLNNKDNLDAVIPRVSLLAAQFAGLGEPSQVKPPSAHHVPAFRGQHGELGPQEVVRQTPRGRMGPHGSQFPPPGPKANYKGRGVERTESRTGPEDITTSRGGTAIPSTLVCAGGPKIGIQEFHQEPLTTVATRPGGNEALCQIGGKMESDMAPKNSCKNPKGRNAKGMRMQSPADKSMHAQSSTTSRRNKGMRMQSPAMAKELGTKKRTEWDPTVDHRQ